MNKMLSSMVEIFPVIAYLLEQTQSKRIVEVGPYRGETTAALCAWARENDASVTSIEIAVTDELREVAAANTDVLTLHEGSSFDWLKEVRSVDFFVIDSEHNYYTLWTELNLVVAHNAPQVIVLHDVYFPWARRDEYYDPERIPEDYRQPYTDEYAITETEAGPVRADFQWATKYWAKEEGGARNGVLTAVEDFLAQHDEFAFFQVKAVFGFGFLVRKDAPNFEDMAQHLRGYSENVLLPRLEDNRTDLYLRLLATRDVLQRGNDYLQRELNHLRREFDEYREAMEAALQAKDEHIGQLEKRLQQLKTAAAAYEQLEAAAAEKDHIIAERDEGIAYLERVRDEMQQAFDAYRAESERYRQHVESEIERKQRELAEAQQATHDAITERDQLQHELDTLRSTTAMRWVQRWWKLKQRIVGA